MDKQPFIILCVLISCIILSGGCLGEKASATSSIKYVCSDGSIVSESRECRIEEKARTCNQICPIPAEKPCICNQTCAAPAEKTVIPVKGNTSAPATEDTSPANQSAAQPPKETVSGPCESMGCPADALFVGNSETKKFHDCDCTQAARISQRKRVCLTSAEYAESHGFVPCGFCKPAGKSKT
ncbi:MAG: hypothetical protein WAX07_05980 [Candidatus Altiarchaeia archaeon]